MALPRKTLGPLTCTIDRPQGHTKVWPPTPAYPDGRTWTYPVDYGYVRGALGEDGEGLDVFLGDDPDGPKESFLKLKPGPDGALVPDETKFLVGVSAAERKAIYAFYGNEVRDKRTYAGWGPLLSAINAFKPKKKARFAPVAEAKVAACWDVARVYGVKYASLLDFMNGSNVGFAPTSDSASPAHAHAAEAADRDQKLQTAFKTFDDRMLSDANGPQGGTESAWGSLPTGGTIG